MKRVLYVCGLLTLGSVQMVSAQNISDDRYVTESDNRTVVEPEEKYINNDNNTSYLSYDDDVTYTARIKRFQRPMVSVGYWSGMYDPYWDMMYMGYPMYRPWGFSWGYPMYSPYSWGMGFGYGYGLGYGFGSPFYYGNPYWGGYGYGFGHVHYGHNGHFYGNGYGLGYPRNTNRNTRGLNNGPRRTNTIGERGVNNNSIRYDNGSRVRSNDMNNSRVNPNRNTSPRNIESNPRQNDRNIRTAPQQNNRNNHYSPSRQNQNPRMNSTPQQPSRNYSPSSSPSRGGSNFSAPSRGGGSNFSAPSRGGRGR